jgi:hypothetical protein
MVCPRLGYAKVPRGQQHLKPKWRWVSDWLTAWLINW